MKKYSLLSMLSVLIMLVSLSGVFAQGDGSQYSAYSQYYTMTSGAPSQTHITAPEKYDVQGKQPNELYFSGQKQAAPYSQYQNYATYTGGYSLWIQGATSWTQYAVVPQGSYLSLIAISPTGGNGYIYEIYPDGQLKKNYYYFYPGYNLIKYYADKTGQYILLYSIDYYVSNAVVINVVNYYPPYQQTSYQQPSYQQQPSYSQPSYQQSSSQQSGYQSSGSY